tara:strand:- start:5050 stop:5223 length:174 start_codon:yes stop_codon:yes gene_type:complete
MSQPDYDALRALYADCVERLGYLPEAIVICDGLSDFIDASVEEGNVELTYFDLVVKL